jgi:ATP-dependent DNA helicase DinG
MVLASDIRRWLAGVEGRSDDSTDVFWINYCRNGKDDNIKKEDLMMCSSPLTPGQTLREHVFRPKRAVVLTSATIDVDPSFVNFKLLVGLDEVDTKDIALKSPYDIEKQAEVLTLHQNVEDHGSVIRKYILDGQAIVLFTSYESLEETYKGLHAWMEQEGINAFIQRKEKRFLDVVEDFKADSKGVLFATSSGWQGIDIKGDALKTVIITKIPFSSDFASVLAKARTASLKAKNLDYFDVYSLPAATIKLLQGVGRLIRSKTDTGKIVILDHKLHSKYYGTYIKAALISKGYLV